ncbi:hypothetical protein FHU29_004663 [Hoyosella altamirensis]|uniref:Uncharacterized protein n=2 Tax=Hoyosella altamirensis TaxID=616997 RepID=A0A839RVA2_9ACTN|nr:hypothetical protein [Hoyosella altamirensis]MBB3040168.1 hypothetical protein [Hoyosella altamirensis]
MPHARMVTNRYPIWTTLGTIAPGTTLPVLAETEAHYLVDLLPAKPCGNLRALAVRKRLIGPPPRRPDHSWPRLESLLDAFGRVRVDSHLIARLYLHCPIEMQEALERDLGRRAVDQIIERFDQALEGEGAA